MQGVIRSFNGLLIIRVKWKAKWKFRHGQHVMSYGKENAKNKYVDKVTRRERFNRTSGSQGTVGYLGCGSSGARWNHAIRCLWPATDVLQSKIHWAGVQLCCACELILSFFLLCLVRAVHMFDLRFVRKWTPNKWWPVGSERLFLGGGGRICLFCLWASNGKGPLPHC